MSECKSVTLPLRAVTAKLRLAAVRDYYGLAGLAVCSLRTTTLVGLYLGMWLSWFVLLAGVLRVLRLILLLFFCFFLGGDRSYDVFGFDFVHFASRFTIQLMLKVDEVQAGFGREPFG